MMNGRWVYPTLRVVCGVALGTFLAAPALGQTPTPKPVTAAPKAAPAKTSLEIEVYGGLSSGGRATGGTGTLPAAGATFSTVVGTPTRSVPSWYFGDGTQLFNTFNTNLGFSKNVIAPLDPALNTSATARKSGGAFGVRVAYPLNRRIAVEGSVDAVQSHLALSSGALNAIEQSRSTFKSTFSFGFAGAPGLSVTSASTIVDTQGQQVFATGGLRINLLDRGSMMPFVTVGAGVAHGSGTDTVQLVGNYQLLSCGGICPKSETDTVNVSYRGSGNGLALVFGGGLKSNTAARSGWRIDARVWVSRNIDATFVSATPVVAPTSPFQSALAFGGSPTIQLSTIPGINSSLSGNPVSNFKTFTGSGTRSQASITVGWFFRL